MTSTEATLGKAPSGGGMGRRIREGLAGVPLVIAVLGVWEMLAVTLEVRHIPRVPEVAQAVVDLMTGDTLVSDIVPSVARALAGLAIAIVVGVMVGLALGYHRRLEPWSRPLLEFFRALPAPALLSAAIVLLGANDTMRVFLIAFACLWPVLLNAMDGARNVDAYMLDTGRIFGMSPYRLVRRVVFPASTPQIMAGIRTAIGLAIIMMVISEFVAASNGIGNLILMSQRRFRVAETYAGVLVLGAIGLGLNFVFLKVERRIIAWHYERRQTDT